MKVLELKQLLGRFPDDMEVVVSAYENGLTPAFTVEAKPTGKNSSWTGPGDWVSGEFEESIDGDTTRVCIEIPRSDEGFLELYEARR
jgi:hypothetical protein